MPAEKLPNCALVVGSISGIRAAKAAGMTAVAVGSTHAREQLAEADVFVPTLDYVRVRLPADRSTLKVVTSSD